MKILNKLVLLSLVLFLSALCFMFFVYNKLTDGTAHGGSIQKGIPGNSPAVQRLGLDTFTVEGMGSIPGQGTKIPQAT